MRLKFKIISKVPILIILAFVSLFLPYIFLVDSTVLDSGHFIWAIYFELLFLATIFFLWYKIYNEIIFAKTENDVLYYRLLFFIKKSIKKEDIKGYKTGNDDSDFFVLYDKNERKLFVIRMDFYSNYYDFIDELNIQNIGVYYTISQRIIRKIFNKQN